MLTENDPAILADYIYKIGNLYLYNLVWKPIEPSLQETNIVYYSTTGYLNSLSFAAIPMPNGTNLIDHFELHQLTTTGRLAYRNIRNNNKILSANLYGAFYYNTEQEEYFKPRLAQMRKKFNTDGFIVDNSKHRGQAEYFPYLECSLNEVDNVEQVLQKNSISTIKEIGEIPTEEHIRKLNGLSPDILLLSTHGFFFNNIKKAADIPYFQHRQNGISAMTSTGLILADGERAWQGEIIPEERDNIFTSQEIATQDLTNTKLVLLSACETALGSFNAEGVFGLQRGFKQAGVQSICASLWSVNDRSTAGIMQSFFRYWISDKKEGAMQRAMIRAMKEQRERTPSPYYWAPFVLYDAIE